MKDCVLIVLLRGSLTSLEASQLQQAKEHWLQADDVLRKEFLQGVIVLNDVLAVGVEKLPHEILQQLQQWGTSWIAFADQSQTDIHPGPYMVSRGKLGKISRLHDDVLRAFLCACTASGTTE